MDSVYAALLVHLFWTANPQWVYVKTGTQNYLFELENNKLKLVNQYIATYTIGGELPKTVIIEGDSGVYRGTIYIKKTENGILILNRVGITDYIASALGSLDPPDTNLESLKAKAICIRSWIYNVLKNAKGLIPDSTDLLVYRGIKTENKYTRKAAKETAGLVLTYENRIIYPFWTHSTGGFTVPYSEVFGEEREYLVSVPDSFSITSPYYEWESPVWKFTIMERLGILQMDSIKITHRTIHEVVDTLRVFGENSLTFSGREFYEILDDKIFSPIFDIQESGDTLYFIGKGKGYLVGLSLWGAEEMAKKGATYREILDHYFPGCLIKKRRKP